MAGKTKQDPTGQARNRKKGTLTLQRRITIAEKQVKSLFRAIPRKRRTQKAIVNQNTVVYDYDLSGDDLEQMTNSVQFILNRQLLESQNRMPINWYWRDNAGQAYNQGTAEEVVQFNQAIVAAGIAGITVRGLPVDTVPVNQAIVAAGIAGITVRGLPVDTVPVNQVLLSDVHRSALDQVYQTNFTTVKGLSEKTTTQVMQQITLGMQAGETPTKITERITERFDVSRSDAKRIANTEINKAYNDAKLAAVKIISGRTGLRAGVIHISALLSTTRETHARRHGNAYTVEQQEQWWNTGVNRINCHCSTQTVLIDRTGNVVDTELQEEIKVERKFFDV